jgi:DNA-binding NarL/FixJ family response regulator
LRSARAWLDGQARDARILVLSGLPDAGLVQQALAHGAVGFIAKAAPRGVLLQAVARTLAGGIYLPQALGPASERAASVGLPDPAAVMRRLTARERAVAALLIRGLTYKRIALTLQARDGQPISEHTVRAHVGNIAWKLGVEENAKAGVMARIARLGLLFGDAHED